MRRTLLMSTAAGAFLIGSAGCADSSAAETNKATNGKTKKAATEQVEEQGGYTKDQKTAISAYPEADILDEQVAMDQYQLQIVEDNPGVRVIFLHDENGERRFKSVFRKEHRILNVIDLDQGLLFKGIIGR
ncbi:hypothetical protein EU245_13125 [Lentibacillus lipolyticus]|nr:hypothetical protein EU245_13125 [Lentibacillus lipolyticus]